MSKYAPKRDKDFVQAARLMKEAGATLASIARALGASVTVVKVALTEGEADLTRAVAPEKVTEIVRLAREGVPHRAIASRMRVSNGAVRGIVEREIGEGVGASSSPSDGGEGSGGLGSPAVAPNSIEASLIARGMRPEIAAETARAWKKRMERPVAAERPVKSLRKSSGPFRLGRSVHGNNMPEHSR